MTRDDILRRSLVRDLRRIEQRCEQDRDRERAHNEADKCVQRYLRDVGALTAAAIHERIAQWCS